jgi:heterodisulfide reductase subunit C
MGLGMSEISINYNPSLSSFLLALSKESKQNVNACFQCRKCAVGCPVAFAMDLTPTQIIHAARLGLEDAVLNSKTIWLCASCHTCTTRCPQDVDIARVMDAARILAVRRGVKPSVKSVPRFFYTAVKNIKQFGRMYELGLIMVMKLKSGEYTKDVKLGLEMVKKGKLKLVPSFKGMRDARRIYKAVQKKESR